MPWSAISGATGQTYDPPALDKTTEFRRTVFSKCGAGASSNAITFTVIQPNGKITGKVSSQQGTGVPDVLVTAKRLNEVPGGAAGVEYTATTDASGNYSFSFDSVADSWAVTIGAIAALLFIWRAIVTYFPVLGPEERRHFA